MTRPLTNKKLFKKFWHHTVDVTTEVLYTPDGMRAAYDRGRDAQLEQAVEWLGNCNMDHSLSYDGEYRSDRYLVINAFREAMRPTQENS